METKHRLTAPAQLTTLTRLDQDVKQIMDSSSAENQKVLLSDHFLQRYQRLTKEICNSAPAPPAETTPNVKDHVSSSSEVTFTGTTPRKLSTTPATSAGYSGTRTHMGGMDEKGLG